MSGLLERDPHTRIGASSWSSLTDHPFFAPLNFHLLENKLCSPIFRPSQDKSNFDAVYELEELLLEQAPLEGRNMRKSAKKPQQHAGSPEGSDTKRSKKEMRRKEKIYEEDKEEEILDMINQFFEPFDYTRSLSLKDEILIIRHESNLEALASLTNEIRQFAMGSEVTPGSTPPLGSFADTPNSRASTGHESSGSVPPMPPIPSSYRSNVSVSPTSDSDRTFSFPQRYVTPPPQSLYRTTSTNSSTPYPLAIRPPPAVARIAGKEKKNDSGILNPPPFSHPTSHPSPAKDSSLSKTGIILWGKRDRDSRSEKWESGVIGRERARIVIEGGNKRH
jgi:serine/threonine kinase 32